MSEPRYSGVYQSVIDTHINQPMQDGTIRVTEWANGGKTTHATNKMRFAVLPTADPEVFNVRTEEPVVVENPYARRVGLQLDFYQAGAWVGHSDPFFLDEGESAGFENPIVLDGIIE